MNIAFISMNVSPLDLPGGQEGSGQGALINGLGRALAELGHRLTVYVRRDDPALPARLEFAENFVLESLDAGPARPISAGELNPWVDEFAAGLTAAWRLEPPEAIHAFAPLSAQAAKLAAGKHAVPVVQTFHTRYGGPRNEIAEYALLVQAAACNIATSSAHVFELLRFGARPVAIKIVPCGVDLGLFAPPSHGLRGRADRLRVVTLGGLRPSEGIADVIEALPLVDGVELVIGGGMQPRSAILADSDVSRLSALAQARGVADRVYFYGRIERRDAAAFLRSADIVVCPPHDDTIGAVALEAMACGLPLIVSAVGGLADAVVDSLTGIHVPPRAPRQIAYALEALRTDPARRERFGRFGIERTRARYGWARIAAETLEIYRSVKVRNPRFSSSRA